MIFFKIPGDCSSEYIEVRLGRDDSGVLVGKYCDSNPPPASLNTKVASVWINFVKTKDSSTSFAAIWTVDTCRIFLKLLLNH